MVTDSVPISLLPVSWKLVPKSLLVTRLLSSPVARFLFRRFLPEQVFHNVELKPGRGGQIARSRWPVLHSFQPGKATTHSLSVLPERFRKIHTKCYATVGIVGNHEHERVVSAKAGRTRWKGIRPTVRGMCMNPCRSPERWW